MLKDLHAVIDQVAKKIDSFRDSMAYDCQLPEKFKLSVRDIGSATVSYTNYGFIVLSSSLYIYFSNQLWYYAAACVEIYNAISEYDSIVKNTIEIDNAKAKQCKGNKAYAESIIPSTIDDSDKVKLVKYLYDYSWWNGGKTIDRGDYYVSPIVSTCKLVNASQSYVAEMCAFLAKNPEAYNLLNSQIPRLSKPKVIGTQPLQQIWYGAPGTGKSHEVNELTVGMDNKNVFRTTFHPDSDYSTFVGCYKPQKERVLLRNSLGAPAIDPTTKKEVYEEKITYKFEPQAFVKAYVRAYQTDEPVALVIEEINRGNCAQIFGDIFQLLDRKNGVSEYPVKPDSSLNDYLKEELGDKYDEDRGMVIPSNLHIWATMNTSDQSLFPIDSAFKRRWDWKYVPINTRMEDWYIEVGGEKYSWSIFLEKVNKEIFEATNSEDKQLGFYFCKATAGVIGAERFVNKVLFYLYNDVFKDYGLDRDFLHDAAGEVMPFKDFFTMDGNVNSEKVKTILENLEVTALNEESPADEV